MSKIKSFRGLLANETQETIALHTNNGSTGYRIKKFQVINNNTTGASVEAVVSIWSVAQNTTTLSTMVDFNNNKLLGMAFYSSASSVPNRITETIIFDNMTFNLDIYITVKGGDNTDSMNYYLELEQVKLDLNENTVATLKDIRNIRAESESI